MAVRKSLPAYSYPGAYKLFVTILAQLSRVLTKDVSRNTKEKKYGESSPIKKIILIGESEMLYPSLNAYPENKCGGDFY